MSEIRIDALLPAEMAPRAEYLGVRKAEMPAFTMFMLSLLAGAFISLGSIFATTIAAGGMSVTAADGAVAFTTGLPYGVTRLLVGFVFCLGLILVVVGGAELFTGNNLIVMAWASGKVTGRALLRNWAIVYTGNFVGSIATAGLMFFTKQYTFGSDAVGIAQVENAVAINADRGCPIAVPVTRHRIISASTVVELAVGEPAGICFLEVDRAVARPEYPGGDNTRWRCGTHNAQSRIIDRCRYDIIGDGENIAKTIIRRKNACIDITIFRIICALVLRRK